MKKIAILTDFSDNAWNALFTGLKLHEGKEVLFYIIHFFEPSYADVLGKKSKERLAVLYESLSKHSIAQLNAIEEYLKLHHKDPLHQFKTVSQGDDLIDGLKEFLKKNHVDLIVMGTRGATKSREVFMGSNAVKVARKIENYPILAVPEKHDFKDLSTIVFPTEFSHTYAGKELTPLIELAKEWNSELIVLQVTQRPTLSEAQWENKEILKKEFCNLKIDFRSTELQISIKESIKKAVENTGADLIAMIKYSHTFFERLTREPVIKKMTFQTRIPMLILPEKEY